MILPKYHLVRSRERERKNKKTWETREQVGEGKKMRVGGRERNDEARVSLKNSVCIPDAVRTSANSCLPGLKSQSEVTGGGGGRRQK